MVLGLPTLAAMLVTLHVADAASSEVPADTVLGLRLPPPAQSTNQALGRSIPVLNWVPRADWLNVQTSCGAKGDGKTDDHAALQACIDRLTDTEYGCNMPGMCSNATKTLYFPPGTYAISQTLVISGLTKMYGGKVLGHGADTTILWTGPASPTAFEWDFRSNDPPPYPESSHSMWLDNGTSYFHYEGISWNGQGKASVGIDHYSHNHYGTFMLHRSESFHGFNISGIRVGGFNGFGEKMATAEVRYQNCHFASSRYGIMPQSYNDLDNLIEGCLFEDLEVGIQTMSHGNFYLRDSRFERSNSSDVVVSATSATIRRVVSINSTMLADSGCCSSAAPLRVEDCRVHQRRELPWNAKGRGILPAIGLSYRGPVQVIDTTFMPTFEHICAANESCVSNMPQRDPSVFKYMNNSITVCPTGSSSEFRNYSVSQWSQCQAECANTTGCMAWSIFPFSNKGYPGVQSVCAVGGFTAGWPKPLPPNFTQSLVPTRRPWSNGGGENSTAPSGCMRCGNGGVDKCAGGYQNSPFIDAFTSGWEQTVIVSNNKLDDKDLLGETGPKSGNEAIVVPQGSLGASQINFDTHFLHSEWPQLCTKIFDAKKDMGAVADGKNDDTAAVQKAIDAAAAASHGACAYLGPGSFKLTAQLTMAGSDFSLEGSGTATYLIAAWPKASNDSMIEIGATASNLSLAGFWAHKPNFQPVIRVAPAESGAAPRFIEIDRVLSMDNWTGIVLQSLGASDTVKMGQIAMTLSVINSSSAVVLVSMNEGGNTLVAKTLQAPPAGGGWMGLRPGESEPPAGFMGELTKISSGAAWDIQIRDSQSYIAGDLYIESTYQNVHLLGAGDNHRGDGGRVTVSGIKLENLGNPQIMDIVGWNGNFSHMSAEWIVNPPGNPSTPPFRVTQRGGGKVEMAFIGEAFDSFVPVFDVEPATRLYTVGNIIDFDFAEDGPTKAFCTQHGGPNKDACVYPDQLEPHGLERVAAAFDHLRVLGKWDLALNYGL